MAPPNFLFRLRKESLVHNLLLLIPAGFVAGFIDAIAGGGGLITLPALTLFLGPGAHAVGTNKIVGVTGAFMAFLVYVLNGGVPWTKAIAFALWVICGSFLGSSCTQYVPLFLFKWLLLITCPVILWVVWKKDLWIAADLKAHAHSNKVTTGLLGQFFDRKVAIAGTICGFYDGMWGPGGGTFMLLGLLFYANLPLVSALAASKLANTGSATIALVNFSSRGYVHWREGLVLASGMAAGAFLGAKFVSKKSTAIVRPVLAIVASLLALKIILN